MITDFGRNSFVNWTAKDLRKEREAEIQMREIKFRAWDKEEKKMIGVEKLILSPNIGWTICVTCGRHIGANIQSKYILMQFTGLKDKNGTEIYEGDIIIIGCYHLRAVIEYEHCGFVMHHVKGSKRRKYCANSRCEPIFLNCNISVEVIGNIHQNPELMEQNNG